MGYLGDHWRAVDAHRKAMKAMYGIPCPVCMVHSPKAPKVLLPTQLCRAHWYRDPRLKLTSQ
jgi:hypothetical protein